MSKKIPDRWLDYTAIGKVVEGSSFVAFKVPLHENICQRLPSPERHTTKDIADSIPRLGLVINLTNTQNDTKYYQPHDWQRHGVEYKWIKTEGHVTPSQSLLIEFCRTVKNFLVSNPDKLVGCHCTHGLNRTGYFVCSFMVLCNNLSPSEAMKNFTDARGHKIERPNYIQAIMNHRDNEELKKQIAESRPARVDGGARRGFSTHAGVDPRRNGTDRPYWIPANADRHDFTRDRSIPHGTRFYSNNSDNSQIGRGGHSIRNSRYAVRHNLDLYTLPSNSSSRSNSGLRHSSNGPRFTNDGNQYSNYRTNDHRNNYRPRHEHNLRDRSGNQSNSVTPDARDEYWDARVSSRMRR